MKRSLKTGRMPDEIGKCKKKVRGFWKNLNEIACGILQIDV